ncbi:MAG: right-handed parallel beta-helix repeat-containing protein [Cloacibacillus evryensis]
MGRDHRSRDLKANVTTLTAAGGASISIVAGGSGATSADTVLDGFTITGGKGTIGTNDLSGKLCGGGMYNAESSPTVANCTFSGNTADCGGGMCNYGSRSVGASPTVTNCTFSDNIAEFGGGMYSRNNSYPVVTNCTFSGNTANGSGSGNGGGGMCNYDASPTVTDCTFNGNTAKGSSACGGGMYNYYHCKVKMTNCTFSGNTVDGSASSYGGGMYNQLNASFAFLTVTNCTFNGGDKLYIDKTSGNTTKSGLISIVNSIMGAPILPLPPII